jgi:Archaeal Type IV pilin, N-terminal
MAQAVALKVGDGPCANRKPSPLQREQPEEATPVMRIPRRPRLRVVPALTTVSAAAVTPSLITTSPILSSILGVMLLVVVVVVVVAVICTAVWSRKKTRRDAALAVLDRIFKQQSER